jgi:hypothetical protein
MNFQPQHWTDEFFAPVNSQLWINIRHEGRGGVDEANTSKGLYPHLPTVQSLGDPRIELLDQQPEGGEIGIWSMKGSVGGQLRSVVRLSGKGVGFLFPGVVGSVALLVSQGKL